MILYLHGVDVTYTYSGDNASVLFMMALCFQDREEDQFEEGDYVLIADLLMRESG